MHAHDIIAIGRHGAEYPGLMTRDKMAVTFPLDKDELEFVLDEIENEAITHESGIVFQNIPAVAFTAIADKSWVVPTGVVVSVPDERPENVIKQVTFAKCSDAIAAAELVSLANPRASVTLKDNVVEITVTPPMRFKFERIDWFVETFDKRYFENRLSDMLED